MRQKKLYDDKNCKTKAQKTKQTKQEKKYKARKA